MTIVDVIDKKRDGHKHSQAELVFIAEAASGQHDVADYQLSAWLMAAYLNGLDDEETLWLTLAMAASGERLDLSGVPKPWLDKHSTGGVGDKTTLVLLPLLAACGITMVKMSGRGLGITGGTIDKLESIPGFRTDLSPQEVIAQAKRIGLAITGQSPNLAPADKTLYGIRDTAGMVSSIPLIASSVLSKKIAAGADHLVLDVKCGSGAFMTDLASAQKLARTLKTIAEMAGIKSSVAISDMSSPLGRCIGNALEVREAFEVLTGAEGRFTDLCIDLAAGALLNVGFAESLEAGRQKSQSALSQGDALEKWDAWILAQTEGAVSGADILKHLPTAPIIRDLTWKGPPGHIVSVDAAPIGETVLALGGGRTHKGDAVDHRVGIEIRALIGTQVAENDPIATIHAPNEFGFELAYASISDSFILKKGPLSLSKALMEWLT